MCIARVAFLQQGKKINNSSLLQVNVKNDTKQVTLKSYLTLNYYRSIKKIESVQLTLKRTPGYLELLCFFQIRGQYPNWKSIKDFTDLAQRGKYTVIPLKQHEALDKHYSVGYLSDSSENLADYDLLQLRSLFFIVSLILAVNFFPFSQNHFKIMFDVFLVYQ